MKYLALNIPGYNNIQPPVGIPATGAGVIVNGLIDLFLIVVGLACLFYLIYGAFKWMTSAGDNEKLANARMTLTYAVIGLVISFLAFMIINTIGNFLGVKLLNPTL